MYSQIDAPQKRLSKNSVKIWMINEFFINVVGFVVLGVLFYLDYLYSWKVWIGWLLIAITVYSVLSAIWGIFIKPSLLYKNWRYDVGEEFLQLKSGAFIEEHHLVPMTKIQSVSTNQGPILRKYGLYSLSIQTMGSSHAIPNLPEDIAFDVRDQIAHYAKIEELE
ncbi:PH domain-containing protein [Salipaludibacillus sp. HK11]|uniref:PH domain-containing protein n=1 Tax=Salipaludibacillus sp. HK11 TaxID=3394320 RepID=UPI0039FBD1E5